MTVKSEYTNKDRWRHIKHFVDTHDYTSSNLEYLKSWLSSFTAPPKESWVGVDDPNQNSYLMNDGSTHSPPRESNRYESVSDESNQYESISDYVKKKGLCISDSPSETNTSDWRDTIPRKMKGDHCFPHGDDEPIC